MRLRKVTIGALFVFGVGVALGGTVCPDSPGTGTNSGGAFVHPPDPTGTGCNAVITIAANGSISTAVTDSTPFNGSEDVIIGVVNNSSSPVGSLNLTGPMGGIAIFGLDTDGICFFTFTGDSYCAGKTSDPADYFGPTTSAFTNISSDQNSGTVVFNPPIPPGGKTFFSLEGTPTASLGVTIGPATPAPSTLTLLGIGMVLLAGWTFRSRIRERFARS